MEMHMKQEIQAWKNRVLFDGAFGTYYSSVFDTRELPELANELHPERVIQIHKEYIEAGAEIIRSNTFASNTVTLEGGWERVEENIRKGFCLAQKATEGVVCETNKIPESLRKKMPKQTKYGYGRRHCTSGCWMYEDTSEEAGGKRKRSFAEIRIYSA